MQSKRIDEFFVVEIEHGAASLVAILGVAACDVDFFGEGDDEAVYLGLAVEWNGSYCKWQSQLLSMALLRD